jgi:hypothetical protein
MIGCGSRNGVSKEIKNKIESSYINDEFELSGFKIAYPGHSL